MACQGFWKQKNGGWGSALNTTQGHDLEKLQAVANAYDTNVTAIIKIACTEFLLNADRKRSAAGWKPFDSNLVWWETGPDTYDLIDRGELEAMNS